MRARMILALLTPGPAVAQQPHHAHEWGPTAAGRAEAQRCIESFDRVTADGRGFGMAFAANRNGYPGRLHVLELRDALALPQRRNRG